MWLNIKSFKMRVCFLKGQLGKNNKLCTKIHLQQCTVLHCLFEMYNSSCCNGTKGTGVLMLIIRLLLLFIFDPFSIWHFSFTLTTGSAFVEQSFNISYPLKYLIKADKTWYFHLISVQKKLWILILMMFHEEIHDTFKSFNMYRYIIVSFKSMHLMVFWHDIINWFTLCCIVF